MLINSFNFSDSFYSNSTEPCTTQNSKLYYEPSKCTESSNVSENSLSSLLNAFAESPATSSSPAVAVLVKKTSEVKRISEKFPFDDQSQRRKPVKSKWATRPILQNNLPAKTKSGESQLERRNAIYFAKLIEVVK